MKIREPLGCLMLVFFYLNTGTEAAGGEDSKKVTGTLEGAVAFQLMTPQAFTAIIWLKSVPNASPSTFAAFDEHCRPQIWLPAFEGRLEASQDCKRLEIRNLTREDSGSYTAQIQLQGKGNPIKETFDLQVYKGLSGSDLTIQCNKTGNETVRLKCSVGPWKEGVEFSWTNTTKAWILGESAVLELRAEDPGLNLTCTATNPVSDASRTVSLKNVCDADEGKAGTYVGIAVGVILGLALVAFITCFCLKKRKETEVQSKTIYAEVENVPNDVEREETRRRGKPVKTEKGKIQTIYTTVDHCKPSPLQTDDEKMRKSRRPPREEQQTGKTTYAEIAAPQESEDRSIKSIYETVKNPQLLQGTEYHVNG